ncbi:oligopeptide transport ATP-binding ABC transport protein [Caballeronia cordobensis]|uniref:Oligopeptide transport ATP-binding ABC transport protein n=1 Tax=Caballeronia cordobensis TaxID=1353886 RepID=A0A158HI99_CABCO|nr:ABC transporter ATP-binding protein [Caballeronia cordobensis]SAL44094.1 oligopeptide transport ATP-binding ABC transport protein [Caballeronia cordobensis]
MNSTLPAVFKIPRRSAPADAADAANGVRTDETRIDPQAVLELDGLRTVFPGAVVVDDVSLSVRPGRTLAVVGESGSGKSMTFLSALGLVAPPGRVTHGRVLLDGVDIARLSGEALRRVRGASISMIFQDPMTALNPVFTIGEQMTTLLRAHERVSKPAARARAAALLERVRIPEARARLDAYPHELSGGMRQRVLIAMAVALRPKVVIADEPTTALDVTVQAQILDLLADLQQETNMAMVLITHDLGLVARYAQDVAVMYAGRVVELGSLARVFGATRHPYTQALFRSIPDLEGEPGCALHAIEGSPPDVAALPAGCAFEPRCAMGRGRENCCSTRPPLVETDDAAHVSACFHWRSLATTENA